MTVVDDDEINGGVEEVITVRQAAQNVGFHDPGIPRRLYTSWHIEVYKIGVVLAPPGRPAQPAGITFVSGLLRSKVWPPKGQLNYSNTAIRQKVKTSQKRLG